MPRARSAALPTLPAIRDRDLSAATGLLFVAQTRLSLLSLWHVVARPHAVHFERVRLVLGLVGAWRSLQHHLRCQLRRGHHRTDLGALGRRERPAERRQIKPGMIRAFAEQVATVRSHSAPAARLLS